MSRAGLHLGAFALLVAAIYHIALLFGPPSWSAFAGAPPEIVASLENGTWPAPVSIVAIAGALLIMAAYGLSGAGSLRRLPLLQVGLWVIASLFLLRGLAIIPQAMTADWSASFDRFHLLSSLIVLLIGLAYLAGAITMGRKT